MKELMFEKNQNESHPVKYILIWFGAFSSYRLDGGKGRGRIKIKGLHLVLCL